MVVVVYCAPDESTLRARQRAWAAFPEAAEVHVLTEGDRQFAKKETA